MFVVEAAFYFRYKGFEQSFYTIMASFDIFAFAGRIVYRTPGWIDLGEVLSEFGGGCRSWMKPCTS